MKKLTTINEQYAQYQLKEPLYEEQFALVEPARSRNNFAQLKKIYERAYEILIPLFNNYQKNNIGIEIAQIKNSDQEFNSAHTICLLVLKNKENKAIVAALNELANAQSDHCYVAINCLAEKIQYVLVCNKNFSTIKCNEFIKLINEQSGGSGGGNPAYAQGGTNLVDRLPKIIEFIKNYQ
jgi:alanyl-tRNA synthetase